MDTVLLAGASGYIGRQVANVLSGAGYRVLCPLREGADPALRQGLAALPGVDLLHCAVSDGAALRRKLDGIDVDAAISCIASRSGGRDDSWAVDYAANRQLLDWALAAGVGHFTLLSAICVQKPRLQFQFAKARFEEELAASGMRYSIVRPTAFFKSLAGQVPRVAAGKPFLLFGNGELTACKPIAERDLADFLLDTLTRSELHNRVLPIGGPGPALTPLEQGRLLAQLAGKPLRTRSISPRLFIAAASLLDALARLVPSLADKAEFARIGHYYATESMLLWNEQAARYDAGATPEYGTRRLEDFYRDLLAGNAGDQSLGEHALFSRSRK